MIYCTGPIFFYEGNAKKGRAKMALLLNINPRLQRFYLFRDRLDLKNGHSCNLIQRSYISSKNIFNHYVVVV